MKYTKIIAKCEGTEDRLSRVLLIQSDVDLLTAGYIILDSFNAQMDKSFILQTDTTTYTYHDSFMDFESIPENLGIEKDMEDVGLLEIEDAFTISYPSLLDSRLWKFQCEIVNRNISHKRKQQFILLEAKGKGIWEDAIDSYFSYLNGELQSNMKVSTLEKKGLPFPENLDLNLLKDTDEFDVDTMIKAFNTVSSEDLIDEIEDYCEFLDGEGIYDSENYGDEFFEDEKYNDFDEDEFDEMDIRQSIFGTLLYSCMLQVDEIEWVKDAFDRLMKQHNDPDYCLMLICREFLPELMDYIDPKNVKKIKEYKKRIEKLK